MIALDLRSLREKRAGIRARLDEVDALTRVLSSGPAPAAAAAAMARVAAVLEDELRPYLEWEGRILHPLVDRLACEGPMSFSASMQHEHLVVDRWIGELAASARVGDPGAFVRRSDRLLGLLAAHFEVEDRLFLPVLDRAAPARG